MTSVLKGSDLLSTKGPGAGYRSISFKVKVLGYLDFYLNDGRNIYETPEVYDAVVNGWLGRENLARGVADVIQAYVAGSNLLELGAGSGALTLELAKRRFTVTAIDIVQNALEALVRKANHCIGEGHAITTICDNMNQRYWKFASDDAFDAVVTLRCNRYIADLQEFLQEAHRSLRPGGLIVFPVFALDMPTWPLHSKRRIFQPTTPLAIKRVFSAVGFQPVDEGRYLEMVHPENKKAFVPIFYRPFILVYKKPE